MRLTYNTADDISPIGSPNGQRIAFASNREGNWELHVMWADGSNQTRLTDNTAADWGPGWSAGGCHACR